MFNTKPTEIINSDGHQDSTIICSSVFEDSACRPREEKLLCHQCGDTHTVHRNNFLTGVFVTEDPEVYHAHVPHNEREGVNVFRDKLIASGIMTKAVYVLGSPVELSHEVIFVPLLYTKMTDRSMAMEMDQNRATNKIYHQAYPQFEEYNLLVKLDNDRNLGSPS